MSARSLVVVLWRRKLVCLVVAILVVVGGVGFLKTQHKVYESTSTIGLQPPNTPAGLTGVVPNWPNLVSTLIPTWVQLISSRSFLDGVAGALPFQTTGAQLQKQVRGESVTNAAIVEIVADLPDPHQAQDVAAVTTSAFETHFKDNGLAILQVYESAQFPTSPVSPRPKLILGATIAVAIILALAAGLVWDRLFGRIVGAGELAEVSGLPVIGILPDERRLRRGVQVVVGGAAMGRLEEAMRSLRTNFVFATNGGKLQSCAITSLGPEEGKTTVAVNLAVAVAELGLRVVLVDGDIHRPRVHEVFGLENDRGLTSTVLGGASPSSLLQPVRAVPNLEVVTAGPPLIKRLDEVGLYLQQVAGFAGLGDLVIVDSPPLHADADVRLLATATEAVLLVVRSASTTPHQLRGAVGSLNALDAHMVGTVLTRAREGRDLEESISYYADYRRTPVRER